MSGCREILRRCFVLLFLGACSAQAAPAFLIEPQTRRVVAGMSLAQVDSLLGKKAIVGRYGWTGNKKSVLVFKYNLVLDHFMSGGPLGSTTATRVMPYFVIYTLPSQKIAVAGTHREIMERNPPELAEHLSSLFAKVIATDTAVCMGMGVDELIGFVERNIGWKHPNWADRLTEFNVNKALVLLEDSLSRAIPSADTYRRWGAFHRARAVLRQEAGFDRSVAAYSKSLALDSNQFQSAFQLGQIRLVVGNPDSAKAALRLFEHVQRRAKGEIAHRALWGIAVSQWRLGWSCNARATIGEYLAIYPQDQGAKILEERLGTSDAPKAGGDSACPQM